MVGQDDIRKLFLKKMFCNILSALFFLFLFYPLIVYGATGAVEVVETEGICSVYGTDTTPARGSAISLAMIKAVKRIVEGIASEAVVNENAGTLEKNLYPKYKDYIRDYRILEEGVQGGVFHVKIRATLSVHEIRRNLEMSGIITDVWHPQDTSLVVEVVLNGIDEYRYFKAFMDMLGKNVQGVDSVSLIHMGSGVAVAEVEMQGNAYTLANELQFKKFEKFSLSVVAVTGDKIELNMVKE